MSAIQADLVAVKDEQRGAFAELARAEALASRDLELFLERAEGPAWTDDAVGAPAERRPDPPRFSALPRGHDNAKAWGDGLQAVCTR